MGWGIEPRKKEFCGGRDARNRRRQHVRHHYARCRRSAEVEGPITSERSASEPERSHVWPQAAEPTGPHREGEEPKPMMHGHEKSDSAIVAMKPPNKAGRPAAEAVERRAEAKENANRCHTCRTQCRESVSQVPERVRKAARPAVKHPRWEPYAGKPHVRFYAGCALQARRTQLPEMAAAAKPSEQPRTESCVVSGNGRCEA
jgi:hypothetical protein